MIAGIVILPKSSHIMTCIISFSLLLSFFQSYSCSVLQDSVLTVSVKDLFDKAPSFDYCYPSSTIHCNLRSAWLVCNSLCEELLDCLVSPVCIIELPYRSDLVLDMSFGSLELSNSSAIVLLGNEAVIKNRSNISRSLFYYLNTNVYKGNQNKEDDRRRPALTIMNISIDGFQSNNGGAIFVDGSCELNLISIDFTRNFADEDGAAIYITHNQYETSITNNVFLSCSASYNGGSIYIDTMNNEMRINNNVFTNSSSKNGGAIFIYDYNQNIFMENNEFHDCFAETDGGAVFIFEDNNAIIVHNNSFSNSSSIVRGGAIMISSYNVNLTITSNSFLSCESSYGGGLCFENDTMDAYIGFNKFLSCYASESGGGMYFHHSNHDITIKYNTFYRSVAYQAGSAIALESQNYLFMISNCVLEYCSVLQNGTYPALTDNGGGTFFMRNNNHNVTIVSCSFSHVISHTNGAITGIHRNGFITIINNQFINISLTYSFSETVGSAIFFSGYNHDVDFVNNMISNCSATYGAVFFDHYNSKIHIAHNTFAYCAAIFSSALGFNLGNHAINATSNYYVSCIAQFGIMNFNQNNHNVVVTNCNFTSCHSSKYYGGIEIANSNHDFVVSGLVFDSCSAVINGGGFGLDNNNSNILINNTLFMNCNSGRRAGGLQLGLQNTNINITYCSFINNYSYKGGGVYIDNNNNNIYFVGNLFQNNSAENDGGGCYLNNGNNNVFFIDEDSFNSIVVFYSVILSGIKKLETDFISNISVVVWRFDTSSDNYVSATVTINNLVKLAFYFAKSRIYVGLTTPPLLLQSGKFVFEIFSILNVKISAKFYLMPAVKRVKGQNNLFIGNKAKKGDGGAIYCNINNNFVYFINTIFQLNSASSGGAMYFGPFNPGAVLTNVRFEDNYCSQAGGGIYFLIYNSGIQIYNATFISNKALVTGGAIHVDLKNGIAFYPTLNNEINITSSYFKNNYAIYGGGIYSAQENILIVKDSVFVGNYAAQGGGVMIIGNSNLSFVGTNFFNSNKATIGGALAIIESYLYTSTEFAFTNILNISRNIADRGSGLYLSSIILINNEKNELTDTYFIQNTANLGGTVYWIYDDSSTATGMKIAPNLSGTVFLNNLANYGRLVATQGLKMYGPRNYEVTVYNKPVDPSISFTIVDFYDQIIYGSVVITPTIIDDTNKSQCMQQNPYLSGLDVVGLSEIDGHFSFRRLEIYCYPNHKLKIQFQADLKLSEISALESNLTTISARVTVNLRKCNAGETIVVGTCTSCFNGTYSLEASVQPSTQCKDCTQTVGIFSCHSKYIDVKSNYWRRHDNNPTVLHCFSYFDSCLGGYQTGDKSCKYGYKGPLCASCIEGFYSDGIQCISCTNTAKHFTVAAIVYTCICTVFIAILLAYLVSKHVFKHDLFSYSKQSFNALYSKIFTQLRIIIATYQIVGAVQYALIAQFPQLFSKLTIVINTLYFDISSLFPVGCQYSNYNFIDAMILWTLMPVIVSILIASGSVLEYTYKARGFLLTSEKDRIFNEVKDKFIFYFFLLSYLILPAVTTKLFRMFICIDIDPANIDSDDFKYYLVADVRIPCYTRYWYNGIMYSSLLILVYPVGIPLLYLWLLSKCKDELTSRPKGATVFHQSNIIDESEGQVEVMNRDDNQFSVPQSSRLYSSVFENIGLSTEGNGYDDFVPAAKKESTSNEEPLIHLSNYAIGLRTLWEPYKKEYWYWEVIECYRRIILTSIISIISSGSSLQCLFAIVFSFIFIRLYNNCKPYEYHTDNILAELGQYQIHLTFFIALIVNSSLLPGRKWEYVLDIILISSNLTISALGMYFAFDSTGILRHIPSIDCTSVYAMINSPSSENSDFNLKFTSLEETNDSELLYNSAKVNSDYYTNVINGLESSNKRENIFEYELSDLPDPQHDEMPAIHDNSAKDCDDSDYN